MDLLHFLPSLSEQILRTVALTCLSTAYPEEVALHAVAVVGGRGAAATPLQPLLGMLLTCLVGRSAQGVAAASWQRHVATVDGSCAVLRSLMDPGVCWGRVG